MNNLSNDIVKIRKNYREIFLNVYNEFISKIQNMDEDEVKNFLKNDAVKSAYRKQLEIIKCKDNFSCALCGACCKLACSEFSPQQLKLKAQNGDSIAKQFIETFIPYKSKEEAEKNYPEYFELLKQESPDAKIYFYHCPKITDDNKCSDYENRPQICKSFPDNPIEFLPKTCAFAKWKEQTENLALKIHAELDIIEFFKSAKKN